MKGDQIMTIKVLGPGCANCKRLEIQTRRALESLGVKADVVKVEDLESIMDYAILRTPGLVVDEQVVSSGRVPTVNEIAGLISDALHNQEAGAIS